MAIIHFSSPETEIKKYKEHPEGGIVGNALIFYEGIHPDTEGRRHDIKPGDVFEFASNTNLNYSNGQDIPILVEHNSNPIDLNGNLNKLGKIDSNIICRPIQEEDLRNKSLTDLIGKIGAFAQVHVNKALEAVKRKAIGHLSAGIDPVKRCFAEVSIVADPSLVGASLLFSKSKNNKNITFSNHGITDYDQAKERLEQWRKPYEELLKFFDIFFGTIKAIDDEQNNDDIALNANALKLKAAQGFHKDILDFFGIDSQENTDETEQIYNTNPYATNVLNNGSNANNNFSANGRSYGSKILTMPTKRRKKRGL